MTIEQFLQQLPTPSERDRLLQASTRASQMILFGSQAMRTADDQSDWDLLCIGEGQCTSKIGKLHLVWRNPQQLESEIALGSELVNHVATHGTWLKGEKWDFTPPLPSLETLQSKARRIDERLSALERLWPLLGPRSRQQMREKLQLDLVRMSLLADASTVGSRQRLTQLWNANPRLADWHSKISHSLQNRFGETQFWSEDLGARLQFLQEESGSRG